MKKCFYAYSTLLSLDLSRHLSRHLVKIPEINLAIPPKFLSTQVSIHWTPPSQTREDLVEELTTGIVTQFCRPKHEHLESAFPSVIYSNYKQVYARTKAYSWCTVSYLDVLVKNPGKATLTDTVWN